MGWRVTVAFNFSDSTETTITGTFLYMMRALRTSWTLRTPGTAPMIGPISSGKVELREIRFAEAAMKKSGFNAVVIHSSMALRIEYVTPPNPIAIARESINAATVADVRRGA